MQSEHQDTSPRKSSWTWLERWVFSKEDETDVRSKPEKSHILWLDIGVEAIDMRNKLYVVPYSVDRYEGDDFLQGKIELWVRPDDGAQTQKVMTENIMAFDEKEGLLFVRLG